MHDVTERKNAQRRLALLSRKVLQAQEQERARVARDLHDELGQIITALRLEINVSLRQLYGEKVSDTDAFGGPVDLIEKATAELRRICEGLRPPLLDDLGLGPAVEQLIKDFEKRTNIDVSTELEVDADNHVPNEIALSVYRILQEATTNIARHSGATSTAVTLHIRSRRILLSVYDNGKGFAPRSRETSHGSGIVGMEERAHLVDGKLTIRSVPGEGTRVELEIPLPASDKRSNQ
jgi:signal transduction histidine kinase